MAPLRPPEGPDIPRTWPLAFAEAAETWRREIVSVPPRWSFEFDTAVGEYRELRHAGRWVSGPASMMGVLGRRHLEVDHSRVLAWLFDPRGRHRLGTSLLQALFPLLTDGELDEVSVTTEELCGSDDAWGFVDIVVRTRDSILVIENKVWAGQHGTQLDLYYDEYVNEGASFFFLTPSGTDATSAREEVKEAWRPMSWRRDVIPNLRQVVEHRSRDPRSWAAQDYLAALREEFRE